MNLVAAPSYTSSFEREKKLQKLLFSWQKEGAIWEDRQLTISVLIKWHQGKKGSHFLKQNKMWCLKVSVYNDSSSSRPEMGKATTFQSKLWLGWICHEASSRKKCLFVILSANFLLLCWCPKFRGFSSSWSSSAAKYSKEVCVCLSVCQKLYVCLFVWACEPGNNFCSKKEREREREREREKKTTIQHHHQFWYKLLWSCEKVSVCLSVCLSCERREWWYKHVPPREAGWKREGTDCLDVSNAVKSSACKKVTNILSKTLYKIINIERQGSQHLSCSLSLSSYQPNLCLEGSLVTSHLRAKFFSNTHTHPNVD